MQPSNDVAGLWKTICDQLHVEDRVPLFAQDSGGYVKTSQFGRTPVRPVLQRSDPMEKKIRDIAKQLVDDYNNHKDHPGAEREFDGMLYMMGWEEGGEFLPLSVGKTETLGRKGDGSLSENLKGVQKGGNKGNFARWGDNYAYHIGDLSTCVLPGHKEGTQHRKYKRWANTLFDAESIQQKQPRLKKPTFFWATAWKPLETTIWEELGPTTLAVSEYLLIGVAGKISPRDFLNRDGVSRPLA